MFGTLTDKPDAVQAWLDAHHGGDRLVAYTRVVLPSSSSGATYGGTDIDISGLGSVLEALSISMDQRSLLLFGRTGLLVATARTFRILRAGGLREKIKETLYEAPLNAVSFRCVDLVKDAMTWRHWIVTLDDGSLLVEPQALGKPGRPRPVAASSDQLVAAVGARVEQMEI